MMDDNINQKNRELMKAFFFFWILSIILTGLFISFEEKSEYKFHIGMMGNNEFARLFFVYFFAIIILSLILATIFRRPLAIFFEKCQAIINKLFSQSPYKAHFLEIAETIHKAAKTLELNVQATDKTAQRIKTEWELIGDVNGASLKINICARLLDLQFQVLMSASASQKNRYLSISPSTHCDPSETSWKTQDPEIDLIIQCDGHPALLSATMDSETRCRIKDLWRENKTISLTLNGQLIAFSIPIITPSNEDRMAAIIQKYIIFCTHLSKQAQINSIKMLLEKNACHDPLWRVRMANAVTIFDKISTNQDKTQSLAQFYLQNNTDGKATLRVVSARMIGPCDLCYHSLQDIVTEDKYHSEDRLSALDLLARWGACIDVAKDLTSIAHATSNVYEFVNTLCHPSNDILRPYIRALDPASICFLNHQQETELHVFLTHQCPVPCCKFVILWLAAFGTTKSLEPLLSCLPSLAHDPDLQTLAQTAHNTINTRINDCAHGGHLSLSEAPEQGALSLRN